MIYFVMLILHMLADFYIQTDSIVKKKKEKLSGLFIHSLIYAVVFFIPTTIISIVYRVPTFIYAALVVTISHFIIDCIKSFVENKLKDNKYSMILYLADQFIHIGILYFSYVIFGLEKYSKNVILYILNKSTNLNNILIYSLMVIILLKPISIFVKKCLSVFNVSEEDVDKENTNLENSGKAIGYFERILTMILILAQQYSLLGLVFTAKSIARFKDLKNGFAERYLIGTLASFIVSLVTILVLDSFLV